MRHCVLFPGAPPAMVERIMYGTASPQRSVAYIACLVMGTMPTLPALSWAENCSSSMEQTRSVSRSRLAVPPLRDRALLLPPPPLSKHHDRHRSHPHPQDCEPWLPPPTTVRTAKPRGPEGRGMPPARVEAFQKLLQGLDNRRSSVAECMAAAMDSTEYW